MAEFSTEDRTPDDPGNIGQFLSPVVPERATPERLQEVVKAYEKYLTERRNSQVVDDPARAARVESAIMYCERTITYYMSFLIQNSQVREDVPLVLSKIRLDNAHVYDVPDLVKAARDLAKSARRDGSHSSAKRQSAPGATSAPRAPAEQAYPASSSPEQPERTTHEILEALLAQSSMFDDEEVPE